MGFGAVNIDTAAIGGVLNNIIDKIFPDKTKAEEAKAELAKLQLSGGLEEFKQIMAVFIAEASSQDKWTSRARPSFLYVMYVFILCAIPIGILSIFSSQSALQIAVGMKAFLSAIPEAMWAVFGLSFSVYSISRSYDKKKQVEGLGS